MIAWLDTNKPEGWQEGIWKAINQAQEGAERNSKLVVEVFRTKEGRVFANVSEDGIQLAHLKAGEIWIDEREYEC